MPAAKIETTPSNEASIAATPHRPAFVAAAFFAVGIAVDRFHPLPLEIWLLAGLGLLALSTLCLSWRKAHGVPLLLVLPLLICVGAARHHIFWSVRRGDDISLFTEEEGRPATLIGQVVSQPSVRFREDDPLQSAIPRVDRTTCLIKAVALGAGEKTVCSGRVRLLVSGHLIHVDVGDTVRVHGRLFVPSPALNPGEFDFRDYLRGRGALCVMQANHPAAVTTIGQSARSGLSRSMAGLRDQCQFVLTRHLSSATLPAASALLLGNRDLIAANVRDDFVESGTMHLMAISGLHVGILAALVLLCCRIGRCSVPLSALIVVGVVVFYAVLTDARPPVLRATLLIMLAAVSRVAFRTVDLINVLATAALILLLSNPSDLFDVGAQLSFLSVAGIAWAQQVRATNTHWRTAEERRFERTFNPVWKRIAKRVGQHILDAYWIMGGIALFTAPLIAARFHLVSPAGFLVNVVLVWFVGMLLWLGFGLLVVGLLLPPLATIVAMPFEYGLQLLLAIVNRAAEFRLGHAYLSGPPTWWLAVWYLLLAAILYGWMHRQRIASVTILLSWLGIGLATGWMPASPDGLRCTFLSVDHGCAILVEAPNGRTMLYDCGNLDSAQRAQRVVQSAMWDFDHNHIDIVVASHADLDHYNGIPGLIADHSAGMFVSSPMFFESNYEGPHIVTRTAAACDVPVARIAKDSAIRLDDAVQVRVLHPGPAAHPPTDASAHREDNPDSIVLLVTYAGRRILLTGDIEGDGLDAILRQPAVDTDVMLAPHHGSLRANVNALVRWAKPEFVVASHGRSKNSNLRQIQAIYGPDTRVFSTQRDGAVTFTIATDGELTVSTYR